MCWIIFTRIAIFALISHLLEKLNEKVSLRMFIYFLYKKVTPFIFRADYPHLKKNNLHFYIRNEILISTKKPNSRVISLTAAPNCSTFHKNNCKSFRWETSLVLFHSSMHAEERERELYSKIINRKPYNKVCKNFHKNKHCSAAPESFALFSNKLLNSRRRLAATRSIAFC